MPAYNIHSHVFTMSNAPERFLHLYLPDIAADLIDKVTNTSAGAAALSRLLSLPVFGAGGKRYASFLRIGKSKNQLEVFENLLRQYDDQQMRFIALSMYMEKCGAGSSSSGFEGQLEELITIKKQYPERLHLFMGIDPRWKLNGTQLRKTVEAYFDQRLAVGKGQTVAPFTGLKLYPSMGFYAFDKNLMETYEWAADKGVPVLSHCYYRGGIYNNDEAYLRNNINVINPFTNTAHGASYIAQRKWGRWLLGTNAAYNNSNTCSYFLEPHGYEEVFKYFSKKEKPLKLCLAHFGGSEMMGIQHGSRLPDKEEKQLYGILKKNWYQQVRELMQNYPGVYTDIAYTLADKSVHPYITTDLNDPDIGSRIMYGTDYFLAERDQPEKMLFETFKQAALAVPLTNYGNITAWDQAAKNNIYDFLESTYQPRSTLIA